MQDAHPTKPKKDSPIVVGIGASAGGLNALKLFFDHVPEDSGLAFVVVVHLSPEHKSHLADLLQPHVKMPVLQVTETIALEVNHVYVIPPGCNLNTIDTHLRLSKLEEKRRDRAPIDHFFRTLASTHDGQSIGVILTGTGSDGTLGIKEIKGMGGFVIVQDPNEAEYDGMPQSAIATGIADLVVPLAQIPGHILRFANTEPQVTVPKEEEDDLQQEERHLLQKVFAQLRAHTGRDYTHYKHSTILRRLQRRMQLHHIEQLKDYLTLLREQPKEVRALSEDFLITVTSFFRDEEVFKRLKKQVIPELFQGKGPNDTIRVWSVGCATGEEAYSLTIMLLEEAAQHEAPPMLQVFASDLHEHSLQKARAGYYPGDIETDVSKERLQRFFVKEDSTYRIRKEVRELVVFAPHNLLGDPPFSKLDLIACRNVMIYLQREVQRDVIHLFPYALKPQGFLLLGTSEAIMNADLFRTEDKAHCLFRKRNVTAPETHLPVFPLIWHRRLPNAAKKAGHEPAPVSYGVLHQRMVEQYAPPSLLVSPDHQVIHLSERAGRYMVHPGGELTASVFKLIREDLRIELRAALDVAKEKGTSVRSKPVAVQIEGVPRQVVLSIYPAVESQQEGYMLVIFEEQEAFTTPKAADPDSKLQDTTLKELEAELDLTKQRLQAIIEEYETSQEEMKASNEELQSVNEELRSTMEELETGKEELQSMNEELSTVNQENRNKVEELALLSADLQNLLKATDIATLFLDKHLRILRITPRVGELFNVRTMDRGRPLSDLTHRLGYNDLMSDAQQVLDKLVPIEREVQDEENRWYLTRVLPYRSEEDRIEGVVITFVDITARRETEEHLRRSEEHLRLVLESAIDYAIFTLDMNHKVTGWNEGAQRILGYRKEEIIGQRADVIFTEEDRAQQAPEQELQKATAHGRAEDERWHVRKDGSRFWGSGTMMPLRTDSRQLRGFLKIMTDDTGRRQMEESLRQAKEEAEKAAKAKEDFLAHMSHEIRTPLNAVVGLTSLLLHQHPKEEQLENMQTLKFSAENLMVLVNDILDFSKIQSGNVSVEETRVNLRELLHSLQKAHHLQAEDLGNELQFHIDQKIPETVRTDQLKLSQVLHNLLSNAIKFTHQGLVSVEVSLNRQESDTLWIDFSVQDTGIGIPEDKLTGIFDAFTQADISTVRQYGGTGLGLTITKLLLEIMHSRIEVESQPGKGTRFFFTLPVTAGKTATRSSSGKIPQAEPEQDLPGNFKVLLVEDVAINRMVMMQFLEQWWQINPDEAEDGEQAVAMAQQKSYDLILMDVRMPLMDGYEATRLIRALPGKAYEQTPILALTADTIENIQKNAKDSLFTGIITKPFDPAKLKEKIQEYLPVKVK